MNTLERIYSGCFPGVITQENKSVELIYSSYISTWLERDATQIAGIQDSGLFLRFIRILASRTAQELNLSEISKNVGVDAKTIDRWLDILLTSGMVYKL